MLQPDLKNLLGRLNPFTKRSLETAAGLTMSSGHYEVAVEHVLLVLLDGPTRDIPIILKANGIEPSDLLRRLQKSLEGFRAGNTGRPVFSPRLVEWITDAWLASSVDLKLAEIRSGALLIALLESPGRYGNNDWFDLLEPISVKELKTKFHTVIDGSEEGAGRLASDSGGQGGGAAKAASPLGADSALAQFAINFTAQARDGKIDPVFCRDREIQQMIDILGRRRKNNPICVGEPGVGKTAVVEGLALKIAEGDVPEFLKPVELVGLDLGLLQAGAGVKGEFENRLKSVIEEVKSSEKPIVLFIDEAHTLIGAGGQAGGSDAANLLKPALARGELRTIAATTWTEYKKYFEKDPALARRFQLVKLDEPTPDEAVTIIRGLRNIFEKSHGVYIRDDAVVAAAKLSARYITGRQLPDKAVDVLDTASARVKLSLSTKPAPIDFGERRIAELERALFALRRDRDTDIETDADQIADLERRIAEERNRIAGLSERWQREKGLIAEILELRRALGIGADVEAEIKEGVTGGRADGEAADTAPAATTDGTLATTAGAAASGAAGADAAAPERTDREALRARLKDKIAELAEVQGRDPLVSYEVAPDAIGAVISDWTGIPVGRMVRDESRAILTLADNLRARVIGQDQAIEAIDQGVRAAKAGLNNPGQPMGVFLLVGPSGVGKTELGLAVADVLFGGEKFLTSINMSEFQERHTVSKLVGSPPGYVGYGEGGVLTEAVRQRPYSVVLLDEVEKADLEVMNIFYQVFDKGDLADGEGRVIDFKNTIIFLTSNLATDTITALGTQKERPSADTVIEAIRPELSRHFKPALLARMQIVPFFPLLGEPLKDIVRLKLRKLARQLRETQKIGLHVTDGVIQTIADRCTEVETGARNIDHIINRTLRPAIATEILNRMSEGEDMSDLTVDVGPDGGFVYGFGGEPPAGAAIEPLASEFEAAPEPVADSTGPQASPPVPPAAGPVNEAAQ